jgi:hypothetical protein
MKQGQTQLRFQFAHLHRDGWLTDVDTFRGPAETASLGHGSKKKEMV